MVEWSRELESLFCEEGEDNHSEKRREKEEEDDEIGKCWEGSWGIELGWEDIFWY